MSLKTKVQQSGRSFTTHVPIDIREHLDLHKGDTIQYVIRDSGAVEIRKVASEKS